MKVMSKEWLLEVARGNVHGAYISHRFGANRSVGTTWETICTSGTYQTPPNVVALELISTATEDSITGAGARQVLVRGIDVNWDLKEEIIDMNGTTPVPVLGFRRVFDMRVYTSGTYATLAAGSHVGTINLREAGNGPIWADIVIDGGFPVGTSEIGCYTVPRGFTAYILGYSVTLEASKLCDVALFFRDKAHVNTGGTYGAMRALNTQRSVSDVLIVRDLEGYTTPLEGPCDTGFLAGSQSGATNISVSYDILMIDNNLRDTIGVDGG